MKRTWLCSVLPWSWGARKEMCKELVVYLGGQDPPRRGQGELRRVSGRGWHLNYILKNKEFCRRQEVGHLGRTESVWRGRLLWKGKFPSLPGFSKSGKRATWECAVSLIKNFRFQMIKPENKVRVFLKGEWRGSDFCFGDSTVNES